jgi:hypothetical protein
MERWCRPFDYVDALDTDPPNPCESGITQQAWLESRKRREHQRQVVGTNEHHLKRRVRG